MTKDEAIAKAVEDALHSMYGRQNFIEGSAEFRERTRRGMTGAILAALRAIEPEWKLTSREATEAMLDAGRRQIPWSGVIEGFVEGERDAMQDAWATAHDAAEGVGDEDE